MTKAESFAMQYGYYDKEKKRACCVGYNAGYKQAEKDVKNALMEWAKYQKAKYQTVAYANGERRILNELIDKLNQVYPPNSPNWP